MNRIFTFAIGAIICAAVVRAGDVKIETIIAVDQDTKPATTFAADLPKLYAFFKTKGVENGDKLRGVWIADDVGDVAPANTKIDEKTVTADGDTSDGEFSLTKPTKGWPVGKYHVDFYVNDELATTAKFTIKAAQAKKDSDDESKEESSDD